MTEQMPFNDDYDSNNSGNAEFSELFNKKITRRDLITKTAGGAVALTLAASLTGCGDDDNNDSTPTTPVTPDKNQTPSSLKFKAVNKNVLDQVSVPEGYEARVLYALGDPISDGLTEWDENNIPTGASFVRRSGECHDGMTFFGMTNSRFDANQSDSGLLVMNHEYVDDKKILHPAVNTINAAVRSEDEALREINCHGVSVIELKKDSKTQLVGINKASVFNRRLTAASRIEFTGPVKGSNLVKTKFSPNGDFGLGTINNCGNGYTPWGTYLTTEENFNQYFSRDDIGRDANSIVALDRYKIPAASSYKWHTVKATEDSRTNDIKDLNIQDIYDRWLTKVSGAEAKDDFRNTTNTFGWIVEIDPFNGSHTPVKRTALGRFAHEDCRASRAIAGQPLAFYMGDDSQGEYIYKFVSDALWDAKDVNGGYTAGDKYMNSGKLYVAKFNFDTATQKSTGEWVELNINNPLISAYAKYKFADQADVLVNTRLAADAVGATKMDRPEWVAVNPKNGEVYVTLTNNSSRGIAHPLDSANPRNYADADKGGSPKGNINGHIIRFKETGDVVTASTFTWDIFLFGAEQDSVQDVNLSKLGADNDFSSPDGMWFDPRGVLWIQTDDGSYTDETNCMMLAALPGQVGDGQVKTTAGLPTPTGAELDNTKLRRFLTGPAGCEITGVTMTPDYKAIFINIQHPGNNWPANHPSALNLSKAVLGSRPRSATLVITRVDGGAIAGEALETTKVS
ncbi:PhoX family phosphatase [Acinetobacter johnsonii]|uniref:PhoX family phosphatase n=1 Tax=Acinetobacter johnsonii TaxID=40214 RepID=A0AA42XEW1_ACIJO|nr:PhoX family phosphatase [Acinetobacter johnsonii]MDH0835466.1 PhoX family phosphatase [Acinetobacter johnsonii]MDH0837943.1 PhoX family phosphatase [Acinetobacter johnsonii]MDH2171604.1 PhoX family phosphatase [Acinetobacter johnsonii]MDH2174909.1 PhoX family phosphatase [Acinetobacter johnsonii]QPF35543.1 PhoX family phosphatase [Acinetobacter johnsonii]